MSETTVQIPAVLIEDVDDAAMAWVKSLAIKVTTNEKVAKDVPVFFFPHERWHYVYEESALRDQNGTLILPAIALKRTGIDRSPGLWAPGVDTEYIDVSRTLDAKTYQRNGVPVYKTVSVPFPTLAAFDYDVRFWTSTMIHCNHIVERIFNALRWRQEILATSSKGSKFVGLVDFNTSDNSNFDEFTDDKRMISFSMPMRLVAYLHTNTTAKVTYSVAEVETAIESTSKGESLPSGEGEDFNNMLALYQSLYPRRR